MTIVINGTTGISGVDGSAGTPAVQGTDTNTGVFYPAADTVGVSTGGSERMRINSSGNVGIGTSSPTSKLQVSNGSAVDTQVQITNSLSTLKLSSFSDGTGAVETTGNYALRLFTNATERMRIDTSGNLLFNSGYGSVATAYGCRAWVNFNGTGTVAIRASGNVTSITDNGVGDYTVNFTTAMPDANYSSVASCSPSAGPNQRVVVMNFAGASNTISAPTSSACRFSTSALAATADVEYVHFAAFR